MVWGTVTNLLSTCECPVFLSSIGWGGKKDPFQIELNGFGTLLMNAWVYFRTLYFILLSYTFILIPIPHSLDHDSFVVCFEIEKWESISFVLFQDCSGYCVSVIHSFVSSSFFFFFFFTGRGLDPGAPKGRGLSRGSPALRPLGPGRGAPGSLRRPHPQRRAAVSSSLWPLGL